MPAKMLKDLASGRPGVPFRAQRCGYNRRVIVRPHDNGWLLITQPDHAALSAHLMTHWTADGLLNHPRRDLILLATREHDAGWGDVDVTPIVDPVSRQLLDFVHAPDAIRQDVWPRSVAHLTGEPYAAALVAQHALHVYRDNRVLPAWTAFFARMEALRDEHLARTPHALTTLEDDYQFVRLGDLLSLFFANAWPGPRVEGPYTVRVTSDAVTAAPDPFDGGRIPFTIRGRWLASRSYTDADTAARAYAAAPVLTLTGTAFGS